MVSISPELSIENAGTYYRVHYSTVGEYYAPTQEPTIGQGVGRGAEALGIAGAITADQFQSLLHGHDPQSHTSALVFRDNRSHFFSGFALVVRVVVSAKIAQKLLN